VVGGPGRDVLYALERVGRASCGPGRDSVDEPRASFFVAPDCERVDFDGESVPIFLHRDGVSFEAYCLSRRFCRARVTIRAARTTLARRTVRVRPRDRPPLRRGLPLRHRVDLNARGRRMLAARRRLPVIVTLALVQPASPGFERRVGRYRIRTVLRDG
jgi:hypothetical protein